MNNSKTSIESRPDQNGKTKQFRIGNLLQEIEKLKEENRNLREGNETANFISTYLDGARRVIDQISLEEIHKTIDALLLVKKQKGRLFLLGVGGSAANCSHAVNDFRKISNIESYTVVDNVSELTARINDFGWDTAFAEWLKGSNLTKKDAIMVLSVGGGNQEKNISTNIIHAVKYARGIGAVVLGIVSRDGGYTRKNADASILVPVVINDMITPYAESFQVLIWHLLVFNPKLREIKPY